MTGWLSLAGAVSLAAWWQIRQLGDLRQHLGAFYGWWAAAFLGYAAALWLIRRFEKRGRFYFSPKPSSEKNRTVPIFLVLLVAVGARLLLLGTTPTLSDDIYRYRWDGRVQTAGIDPYAHAPNDPTLTPLRDADWERINFPHLRTVYPPLAQLAFRLGIRLHDTLLGQKAVFVAAELLILLALAFLLVRRGRSPLWVAAYAWHPLAILEVAGSGHNDTLGIAALWLGLAAWQMRRPALAAVGWASAFLSKYATVILVPWWWCRRTAHGWLGLAILLAAVPIACCPTVVTALMESLSAMTARFESNASVYLVLAGLLRQAALARIVAIGLWVVLLLWWARREDDPIRYLFKGMAAAVFLSPVLHPWYLLWLIPCFCFWRPPALMALTGTVVLAYTVWPGHLADGRWTLPVWAHLLEYAPVAILGLWSARTCVWRSSFLPATKPRLLAKS